MQAAARSERARKAPDALGTRAAISMTRLVLIVLRVLFPSAAHAERRVVLLRANNRRQPKSSVTGWTAALKTFPHL
jgi:hypothetical protein